MTLAAGILAEAGYWILVILGVGLLVFIHELGHFAVAKWSKVKVLAFSLGFGPVLAGFHRGGTHYRVSAIPLGGYVKMSGENELEGGGYAPDDFPAKPLWVRALIMLAGVVMNAVLAYVLFATAFALGVPVDPARAGAVAPGKPAWRAGIRTGDTLVSANGQPLLEFADLMHASLQGQPLDLEVERDGERFRVAVTPEHDAAAGIPLIGVGPWPGRRVMVQEGGDAGKAGLRTGDEIVAVEGVPAGLARLLTDARVSALLPMHGPLHLTVRRTEEGSAVPTTVHVALPPSPGDPLVGIAPYSDTVSEVRPGGAAERAGFRAGHRPLGVGGAVVGGERSFARLVLRAPPGPLAVEVATDAPGGATATLSLPADAASRLDVLSDLAFARDPSPTRVEVFAEGPPGPDGAARGSPAAMAGIPSGARIASIDGAVVATFDDVLRLIRKAADAGGAVTIAWHDGPSLRSAAVTPVPYPTYMKGIGAMDDRPVVRVTSLATLAPRAWSQSMKSLDNIVVTVKGMLGGSVDRRNLGGVILIGQVARSSAEQGSGRFLWILAMLSMNLAVLNLLPIPLLDGGQLALLGLEAVLGRPPSEGIIVASQWVGLVLILGLMALGLFNDVGRLIGG